MWIDRWLPILRRHPFYGLLVAIGLIVAVVILKRVFPDFPAFLPLYPVVVLSAFVGGRPAGILAWVVCTGLAAYYFAAWETYPGLGGYLVIAGFAAVCGLIVFVVDLLDHAVQRLQHERRKLDLALAAADLASWELEPGGRITWDSNFFAMVGLDPNKGPPSIDRFLEMVNPKDRPRIREARELMDKGLSPSPKDEFRLTTPDGRTVWLEIFRAAFDDGRKHFIGITQNISSRKRAERRINQLMQELAHRVKNQYSVIIAMVRETSRQVQTAAELQAMIEQRIVALSRSQDLMLHGQLESADLRALLDVHAEAFGVAGRIDPEGPPVALSAMAAQYLGLAFHELCTNAVKHGAFSVPEGRVSVRWAIETNDQERIFKISWTERSGRKPSDATQQGFGWKVLKEIAPWALSGAAEIESMANGLNWSLSAPANMVVSTFQASTE
jgi:two-component sensor histidine kinase